MGSWFQRLFDKRQEETFCATVLSRRAKCTWLAVFQTDCGQELTLSVNESQYRDLKEGLRMQLTRKGNILIAFTPKE